MTLVSITEKVKFIESAFGKGMHGPKNFDVRCPIPTCHSRKNLVKKKLSIHIATFMCHCWSCGYSSKSLHWLLLKYVSREKRDEFNSKFCPDYVKNLSDEVVEEKKVAKLPEDFRLIVDAPSHDFAATEARRYVTARGLSEDDMWFYRLGVSNEHAWASRVIMPSFDANGELNFVFGRALRKVKLPHLFSEVDRKSIIFNEINIDWTKQVVLCEGPFDAVSCGQNAIPMLGSMITEKYALFTAIVTCNAPIVLAMDADTWDNKMLDVLKKLQFYDVDVKVVNVSPFKDPGSMTKKEFREILGKAVYLSWEDAYQMKVDNKTKMKLCTM